MSVPIPLHPFDEHNRLLQANVQPPDWLNPQPRGRYHLVVIGAGTAGLVSAAGAAGLGARVALIERQLMGGDCLNVGCVPSKGVISAARAAAAVRDAGQFGVRVPNGWHVDFASAMERMRRLRASISPHDSAARFRDLGIDVYLGSGRFINDRQIEVSGQTLDFKKAVIATGARAGELPIPGISEVNYLTNESVFSLTERPSSVAVIGGGPIGSEMAQVFARFGSRVTQIEREAHILFREDEEAAQVVQRSMLRDGVNLLLESEVVQVRRVNGRTQLDVQCGDEKQAVVVDQILVGIGRAPNVENMGLEDAGVKFDRRQGIQVNDRLQTTNPRIFAAGDVCSDLKFTHAADFMARIVIRNALLPFGRAKLSALTIPWTTYTSPELAHVGLHEKTAREQGIPIDTFTQRLSGVDRAILEGDDDGFVRVHVRRGTDKILGATIVATNAGDLISEISLAMTNNLGLKQIANTIHPYPTQADAIRKVADRYNRTRLTPMVKRIIQAAMGR